MSEFDCICLPCIAILGCFGLCLTTSRGASDPCTRGCFSCCGGCCRETKHRDTDHFVSEVEREMAEERARQQALVQRQPDSGPSMSMPRSDRSREGGERRKSRSRDGKRSRDKLDQRPNRIDQHEKAERHSRHQPHHHQYPPNPYPERSPALERSQSDHQRPERGSKHAREARSADFRQSVYGSHNPNGQNYPPAPYPKDTELLSGNRYDLSFATMRSGSDNTTAGENAGEKSTHHERRDKRPNKSNKYMDMPMPNVPVVHATRTRSREDRVDVPPR